MPSAISNIIYSPSPTMMNMAASVGGTSVAADNQADYQTAFKLSLKETVDRIAAADRIRNERRQSADLQISTEEPAATGSLRLSRVYSPAPISVLDGEAVLFTGEISSYLPDKTALSGRQWVVLRRELVPQLQAAIDGGTAKENRTDFKPATCRFTSYPAMIDGIEFSEVFVLSDFEC